MMFSGILFYVIFSSPGNFYVHQSCALWSSGVTRSEDLVMENVGPAVLQASKRRCSFCSHYGATITCIVTNCSRILHFPCAAASGAFQDCKTVTMVCNQHLDQVPLLSEFIFFISEQLFNSEMTISSSSSSVLVSLVTGVEY